MSTDEITAEADTLEIVNVSQMAWEYGFEFPTQITADAMAVIEAPEAVVEAWPSQTTDFRLRAFIQIAHSIARAAPEGTDELDITVPMAAVPEGSPEDLAHCRSFTMRVVYPEGEPVVLIMLKGEFDE